MKKQYDFSGWVTRAGVKCSDGRTISNDAFKLQNGTTVPLVWNHQHDDIKNVLGYVTLEHREQDGQIGEYGYASFNDTENGRMAKQMVEHGDIVGLSIYANQLNERNGFVTHGMIREVSLVLAGANPKAYIDNIMSHADGTTESAVMCFGAQDIIMHADTEEKEVEVSKDTKPEQKSPATETDENKTVGDILDTMSESELEAVSMLTKYAATKKLPEGVSEEALKKYAKMIERLTGKKKDAALATIGYALENQKTKKVDEQEEEEKPMTHTNIFEGTQNNNYLSHEEQAAVIGDGKRYGTLRESVIQHGIEKVEELFPEAKAESNVPGFITKDLDWVDDVMHKVHHTPFSRVKSLHADLTQEEARALGYLKGKLKKEEVFTLLKRTTSPTTVYKKQKMHRDDLVDITDFDVVSWLKSEMRMMLNAELARAFLVGDGRLSSSDDKISEECIRPIAKDSELFTIKKEVAKGTTEADTAKNFIKAARLAKIDYKGSGATTLYATEEMITNCLLLEDGVGRPLYQDENALAKAMRVSNIVPVPVMEGATDRDGKNVMGIIVNLKDYTVGADKGGAVSMFDDFDIDYNAQKYLIETRCSGALTKPYSAIVLSEAGE